jgi:hypothetical protein
MASGEPGHVDFGPEGFIARCEYDPALVAKLKEIQRLRWLSDRRAWVVEPHWPSVRRLLHIAAELDWEISVAARAAEERVRSESEGLEYSVDVVHDSQGESWFQCKTGDDDRLLRDVKAIPGAFWDEYWWIPTDWDQCCEPLLAIVQSDMRIEVSNAAWNLLTEEDVAHLYVRSSLPSPTLRTTASSTPWIPGERDLLMYALSSAIHDDGFEVSRALQGQLLPFQIAGVRYLCTAKRAFLADETGLGKTVQALAAIETSSSYPALIVCPVDSLSHWQREAAQWLPSSRSIAVMHPDNTVPDTDVVIAAYSTVTQCSEPLIAQGFQAIVADESHYLKNPESKRTIAAVAVARSVTELRLCLSGAPLPSQPRTLAPQLAFLGVLDEVFGGFWSFAERYCPPERTSLRTTFGAANLAELATRLRSHCYCQRDKNAVFPQLPAKINADVSIALDNPG